VSRMHDEASSVRVGGGVAVGRVQATEKAAEGVKREKKRVNGEGK
jgi:hypothetical protein